jgi:hypothetical protein
MKNASEQIVSCTYISSVKSTPHPTTQTKSKKYSVYVPTSLPRQPNRMRHRFIPTSFSTMTNSNTYQILTFLSESPCTTRETLNLNIEKIIDSFRTVLAKEGGRRAFHIVV